jgi:D-aminoacyl-tRNA deacylase
MRALIQRVKEAAVKVDGRAKAVIGPGLLILLGIEREEDLEEIAWLSGKLARLRIFNDSEGKMNRSITEINGQALVVSQFTLFASVQRGNRPSYSRAAPPETARPLYERFVQQLAADLGQSVQTGEFGAVMEVTLVNDGPVTLLLDSKLRE